MKVLREKTNNDLKMHFEFHMKVDFKSLGLDMIQYLE